MSTAAAQPADAPVFKKCVRCDYSLRGLPANHACPECGLRYDERCEMYEAVNPRGMTLIVALILGYGLSGIDDLPLLADFATLSAGKRVEVLAGLFCILLIPICISYAVRFFRSRKYVAVTSDGLMLCLAGVCEDLIPWSDIADAAIETGPVAKAHAVTLWLEHGVRLRAIGGASNVFPTHAHAERFVDHVRERVAEARGEVPADPDR